MSRLSPIENADRLEVAEMEGKGWKVVVSKGEFHEGDLAVYFEIDSLLPSDDSRYEFLKDRCLRKFVSKSGQILRDGIKIKTIKLRGVLSQGLLIPISQFVGDDREIRCLARKPTSADLVDENGAELPQTELDEIRDEGIEISELVLASDGTQVVPGTDLTAALKVEHYDEVAEMLRPATGGGNPVSADAYGKFPSELIPKTDEERIQNLSDWFETMKDRKWEITAKFDGSSMTVFYSPTIDPENPFGVCSRNLRLKEFKADGTKALMWSVAEKYDLANKLKSHYDQTGREWALQMECVGPGVNGDRDKYIEHGAFVFRIWDVKKQCFVEPSERRGFCERMKIPHVQVIATGMPFFDKITTMEDALKFAEGKTLRGNER
ncbi:MAG: hypothetical protein MJZ81_09590 [Bacteroidales bacterium]|nr:hypothetical protein [Bacteroidales bacterium]